MPRSRLDESCTMSKISVRELLQTLELFSTKNDHESCAHAPLLQQSLKRSDYDKARDAAAGSKQQEPSGRSEAGALESQQPASAEHETGAVAPADNRASAAVLRAWRSRSSEVSASASRDELPRTTAESSAGKSAARSSANNATMPGVCVSPHLFRGDLRAVPLSPPPTPAGLLPIDPNQIGAAGEGGGSQSVLDAAAILFPDAVERAEYSGMNELPLNAPSTIVQRVIRKLDGMQLLVSHAEELQPRAATVRVSNDGQEVLWTSDGGTWSSFFVREVKDLSLARSSVSKLFLRASGLRAVDRVFCIQLSGRSVAFEAETLHLMRLCVVGMLVLLESAASVTSTVRIWRSLAPHLQLVPSAAAGSPSAHHAAPPLHFPSSVESFVQLAQKHLPIPESLIVDEPLMAGTFSRRVECAGVVALVSTSVMLGA